MALRSKHTQLSFITLEHSQVHIQKRREEVKGRMTKKIINWYRTDYAIERTTASVTPCLLIAGGGTFLTLPGSTCNASVSSVGVVTTGLQGKPLSEGSKVSNGRSFMG